MTPTHHTHLIHTRFDHLKKECCITLSDAHLHDLLNVHLK
jgi:hypothetical protein